MFELINDVVCSFVRSVFAPVTFIRAMLAGASFSQATMVTLAPIFFTATKYIDRTVENKAKQGLWYQLKAMVNSAATGIIVNLPMVTFITALIALSVGIPAAIAYFLECFVLMAIVGGLVGYLACPVLKYA